jgi:hypothetical protein
MLVVKKESAASCTCKQRKDDTNMLKILPYSFTQLSIIPIPCSYLNGNL